MRQHRTPNGNGKGTTKLFVLGRDGKHRFLCEYPRDGAETFAKQQAKQRRHAIVIQYPDMTERHVKTNGFSSLRKGRTPRQTKRKPNRFNPRRLWKRRNKR